MGQLQPTGPAVKLRRGRPFLGIPSGATNPKLLARASALPVVADGTAVASWPDSGPLGSTLAQATGSRQPAYKPGVIQNLPGVKFDGSSDIMQSANGVVGTATSLAIYVVARLYSLNAGSTRYLLGISDGTYGGSAPYIVLGMNAGKFFGYINKSGQNTTVEGPVLDYVPHVFELAWVGGQLVLTVDGVAYTSSAAATSLGLTAEIDLGGININASFSAFLEGYIYHAEVHSPAPDATARTAKRAALAATYGGPYTSVYIDGAIYTNGAAHLTSPGLVRTTGGRLRAYWREATADASTDGTVKQAYSDDDGATWTNGADLETSAVAYQGSSEDAIIRLANDDLLRFYMKNLAPATTAHCKISADDGATWGSEINITGILSTWWYPYGRPVQLANGDILAPGYGRDGANYVSAIARSQDGGATWAYYATIGSSATQRYSETAIAHTGGTSMVAIIRNDLTFVLSRSTSSDDGATWTTPVAIGKTADAPVLQYVGGHLWLSCRGTPNGYFLSHDNGLTWAGPDKVAAAAQTINYSSMLVENGMLWVAYTIGTHTSLRIYGRGEGDWV